MEVKINMEIYVKVIFVILGFVTLIFGFIRLHKLNCLFKRGIFLNGVVVAFSMSRDADGANEFNPIVEYIDNEDLNIYRFESGIQKGIIDRYVEGEKVEIIMMKIRGKRFCEINNKLLLYVGPFTLILFGLLSLLGVLISILYFS
jgi:hypothetical protein